LIICALSTATELQFGVRRSGVMHVAECVLRIAGMLDATKRLLEMGCNGNAFIRTPIPWHPDQGKVGWRSISAYQDAELLLRDRELFQAS
jgi:hypothetical protein